MLIKLLFVVAIFLIGSGSLYYWWHHLDEKRRKTITDYDESEWGIG